MSAHPQLGSHLSAALPTPSWLQGAKVVIHPLHSMQDLGAGGLSEAGPTTCQEGGCATSTVWSLPQGWHPESR